MNVKFLEEYSSIQVSSWFSCS